MDAHEMKMLADNFQKMADAFKLYAENTSLQINRLIEMQNQAVSQQMVLSDVVGLLLCFNRLLAQSLKQRVPEDFAAVASQLQGYVSQQSDTFRETHRELVSMLCCQDSDEQNTDDGLVSRIPEWIKQNPGDKKH